MKKNISRARKGRQSLKGRQTFKGPIVKNLKAKATMKKAIIEKELKKEDEMRLESKKRVEKKLKQFINPLLVKRRAEIREELVLLRRIIHQPGCGAIKISNIRPTVTEEELGAALEQHAGKRIRLLNLCNSDKVDFSRNHAYVFFRASGVAKQMAADLNNTVFLNKVVKVSFIEPQNLKPDQFRKEITKKTVSKMTS